MFQYGTSHLQQILKLIYKCIIIDINFQFNNFFPTHISVKSMYSNCILFLLVLKWNQYQIKWINCIVTYSRSNNQSISSNNNAIVPMIPLDNLKEVIRLYEKMKVEKLDQKLDERLIELKNKIDGRKKETSRMNNTEMVKAAGKECMENVGWLARIFLVIIASIIIKTLFRVNYSNFFANILRETKKKKNIHNTHKIIDIDSKLAPYIGITFILIVAIVSGCVLCGNRICKSKSSLKRHIKEDHADEDQNVINQLKNPTSNYVDAMINQNIKI